MKRLAWGSGVKRLVIIATSLALSLSGSVGVAMAQDKGTDAIITHEGNSGSLAQVTSLVETPTKADLYQKSNEAVTAVDGNAAAMGPGDASAAPGTVTRGAGLLAPDGSYNVRDSAPSSVSISGDTEVIAPPADAAPTSAVSCGSYASWYDAQVAYEAAGATAADPAMVQALDPDYDGIACEDGM
jgi:hypothetical protein